MKEYRFPLITLYAMTREIRDDGILQEDQHKRRYLSAAAARRWIRSRQRLGIRVILWSIWRGNRLVASSNLDTAID